MLPKTHIFFGLIFFLLLYFVFHVSLINSVIFFLSSFLIDVDHYIYYVLKKKDLSLKRAYKWFLKLDKKYHSMPEEKRKNYYYAFCIFHGLEPLIIISSLAFLFHLTFLFFISLGFLFHLSLDFISIISKKDNPFVISSLIYKRIYDSKRRDLGIYT